jgi:GNAT superfamily N-acetyltransferase
MTSESLRPLLDNHLAFLRSHRGQVAPAEGGFSIQSVRPEFTYFIVNSNIPEALLARHHSVHNLPWSGLDPAKLQSAGFDKTHTLVYMTGPPQLAAPQPLADITTEKVSSADALEEFTEVQCSAFLENPRDYADWHPFLRAANFANLNNKNQAFYIVRERGRAVSVSLTVRTNALVGLYAVATKPDMRMRGLATQAMSRAIADARTHHGCDLVTLQVVAGTVAERIYNNLGFKQAFAVDVFKRKH